MWLVIFLMVVAASGGVPVYLGCHAPSHRKTSHAFAAAMTGPRL
jgi:hypothetical protein